MAVEEITSSTPRKRSRSPENLAKNAIGESAVTNAEESSSDDDVGPALQQGPRKKRKTLPHEKLFVAALPASARYSKSLMHKEQLLSATFTPNSDFLITSSIDGHVKFWKKVTNGIEFVKEFKAHDGTIVSTSVSEDGQYFATAGSNGTVKLFDVVSFDLLAKLTPAVKPKCVCYVHAKSATLPLLAVSSFDSGEINIYDGRGEQTEPVHTITKLHRSPVTLMAYNSHYDCVVSIDQGGMIEYWRPSDKYEKPDNVFDMKSTTSLFEYKKAKSLPASITMSPTGEQFAIYSFPDRKVRVFDFASGKLYRTYDESLDTVTTMQQAGTALEKLEDVEFGRRIGTERDIEELKVQDRVNVIFDESGNFILYGSILGVKLVNTLTNRVTKLYGREESFRPLHLALYQGQPSKKGVVTVQMAASDNPLLQEAESRDAMLVATGYGKVRFYMFTNELDFDKSTRDVHNEKPRELGQKAKEDTKQIGTGTAATIHTSFGDIAVKLYPQHAPKAVENFVTHARSNYYNGIIFHRIIRKFMIQTGDPLGDGTGGASIWGKEFEDEFTPALRHDKAYTLSMANAGPGTNGSQFFITTEKTPWLDDKHTIFGRVTKGMDVVHQIENTKVWKEKPVDDISIISISVA